MSHSDRKYQVFISSTYEDLVQERSALIRACLEFGHIPIGMEMFSAGHDDQWTVIQRTIEQCDYYVVIISHRYGTTRTLPDGRKISYTELEYDFAVEKGVPVIALLAHADVAVSPSRIEPDELRTLLAAFKTKAKQRMCKFWKSPEDLAMNAIVALGTEIQNRPRPGWIRGTNAASQQLAEELARLSSENESLRSRLSNIDPDESIARRCRADWDFLGQHNLANGLRLSDGSPLNTQLVFMYTCKILARPMSEQVFRHHLQGLMIQGVASNVFPITDAIAKVIDLCTNMFYVRELVDQTLDGKQPSVQFTERGHALRRWIMLRQYHDDLEVAQL